MIERGAASPGWQEEPLVTPTAPPAGSQHQHHYGILMPGGDRGGSRPSDRRLQAPVAPTPSRPGTSTTVLQHPAPPHFSNTQEGYDVQARTGDQYSASLAPRLWLTLHPPPIQNIHLPQKGHPLATPTEKDL